MAHAVVEVAVVLAPVEPDVKASALRFAVGPLAGVGIAVGEGLAPGAVLLAVEELALVAVAELRELDSRALRAAFAPIAIVGLEAASPEPFAVLLAVAPFAFKKRSCAFPGVHSYAFLHIVQETALVGVIVLEFDYSLPVLHVVLPSAGVDAIIIGNKDSYYKGDKM